MWGGGGEITVGCTYVRAGHVRQQSLVMRLHRALPRDDAHNLRQGAVVGAGCLVHLQCCQQNAKIFVRGPARAAHHEGRAGGAARA